MTTLALLILAAYLAGSIPFGLLVARIVSGMDIRTQGSGNIGATNVGRVLGAKWGLAVLLLDVAKGAVPTLSLPLLAGADTADPVTHLRVACGLATIVGHIFPCWLRFRGGKGVATALGVVAVLAPWATLVAFATFALSFAVFRIVSLSSILAATAFFLWGLWSLLPDPFAESTWSLAMFDIAVPALIIVRHRANLGRLLRGEEPKFRTGQTAQTSGPPERQDGPPTEAREAGEA